MLRVSALKTVNDTCLVSVLFCFASWLDTCYILNGVDRTGCVVDFPGISQNFASVAVKFVHSQVSCLLLWPSPWFGHW